MPSIRTHLGVPCSRTNQRSRLSSTCSRQRQASVWHACQLKDLRVVPRDRRRAVPPAPRDRTPRVHGLSVGPDDRAHHVWDKVFFNLGDFGRPFAWGMRAVPNVYGPITLQFAPAALAEASDVAICLRSASSRGFDRDAESLRTADEVEQLFDFPVEIGFPRTADVKYGDSLRSSFPFAKDARRPEISCSRASGAVSFQALVVVWVDPIDVDGAPLGERVQGAVDAAGLDAVVRERSMMRRATFGTGGCRQRAWPRVRPAEAAARPTRRV